MVCEAGEELVVTVAGDGSRSGDCEPCAIGKFSNAPGSYGNCETCVAGRYTDITSSTACYYHRFPVTDKPFTAVKRAMGYFVCALLLVLPTISRHICQTFRCHEYDDKSLLEVDLEVDCRGGYYQLVRMYAMLMVAIYPLGVSAMLWAWLYS